MFFFSINLFNEFIKLSQTQKIPILPYFLLCLKETKAGKHNLAYNTNSIFRDFLLLYFYRRNYSCKITNNQITKSFKYSQFSFYCQLSYIFLLLFINCKIHYYLSKNYKSSITEILNAITNA